MPFGPLPRYGRLLFHADELIHSCPGDFGMTVAPPSSALHILLVHHRFSRCAYPRCACHLSLLPF